MLAISDQLTRMRSCRLSNFYSSRRFITRKYRFLHLAKEPRYAAESPIEPARTERFERESERNREKRGRRKRETANRSLNERGDWRFNQHADVPGTDIPWLWSVGVGVPLGCREWG